MDGWLLLEREEMGEIIISKIRNKDKMMGDEEERGEGVCVWGRDEEREWQAELYELISFLLTY